MFFAARQLVEKCHERDDALFVLFVDLKKAYDSVPWSALWRGVVSGSSWYSGGVLCPLRQPTSHCESSINNCTQQTASDNTNGTH